MRAEIAKTRYLPTPRWCAAAVLGAVVAAGVGLAVSRPDSASTYTEVMSLVVGTVFSMAAIIFGVWMISMEFSAGTLQRTLVAEHRRSNVLAAKLVMVVVGCTVVGVAAAAAGAGIADLAARQASVTLDNETLARTLFGSIPIGVLSGVLGFAFGLLTRSMGGGIALAFAFRFVLDGVLSFVPGMEGLTFGSLSGELTSHLTGVGVTDHSVAVVLLGVLAWLVVVLTPGWFRFATADLK